MQECIELPPSDEDRYSQPDDQQLKTKMSPNPGSGGHSAGNSPAVPRSVSKFRHNNESQESLQYSTSTYKEDTHRSPKFINLPLLELEKPKIKVQESKHLSLIRQVLNTSSSTYSKGKTRNDSPQSYNPAMLIEPGQRKTLETRNTDVLKLMKRNKELEYALQLETMVSQELRSKISIMSETLENNIKLAGYGDFLKLKNSGKGTNIDLFLEVQKIKKDSELKEKDLGKVRQENQSFVKHLTMRTQELEKANRKIKGLESQVKLLKESLAHHKESQQVTESQQKQSLIAYTEEVKAQHKAAIIKLDEANSKIKKLNLEIEQLKQELKQSYQTSKQNSSNKKRNIRAQYELELNKFSTIISDKNELIDKLNRQADEMREEYDQQICRRDQIIQVMEQRILQYEDSQQQKNLEDEIIKIDIGVGDERTPPKSSVKKNLTTPSRRMDSSVSPNPKNDSIKKTEKRMMDRLKWQLDSYKQECQYYHEQYLKKMSESAQLHALKLQYKTDIQYLKDKIKELSTHNPKTPKHHLIAI